MKSELEAHEKIHEIIPVVWVRHAVIAAAISIVTGILSGYVTVQVLSAQLGDTRQTVSSIQANQQQEFLYLNQRIDTLQRSVTAQNDPGK